MNTSTFSNIPVLNVNEIINKLSRSYSKLINNNISIKSFPSVMLWGAPGVGKSQAIRQIAKEITSITGKETKLLMLDYYCLIQLI
jgi:replication-associated recombination protein RarA